MRRLLSTVLAAGLLCAAAHAEEEVQVPRDALAVVPDDALFVLAVDDWARTRDRCRGTSIGKLLVSEDVKPFLQPILDACEKEMRAIAKSVNVDLDGLMAAVDGSVVVSLLSVDPDQGDAVFLWAVHGEKPDSAGRTHL